MKPIARSSPAETRYIDLHMHSTASDGGHAPARLMEMAHSRGLSAVALTDHDTTAGLNEAAKRAGELGLEFIGGIELEAAHRAGVMHILGYFVSSGTGALADLSASAAQGRSDRNTAVLDRLAALGHRIDRSELGLREISTIGRPHIADALVKRGVVRDFRSAFDEWLGEGGKAFVPLKLASAERVVEAITADGGAAVLAHPVRLKCASSLELRTIAKRLRDAGMIGLEVWHPSHSPDQVRQYEVMARELNLCPTGGSDFHRLPPKVEHGVGFGRVRVTYDVLDALKSRRESC